LAIKKGVSKTLEAHVTGTSFELPCKRNTKLFGLYAGEFKRPFRHLAPNFVPRNWLGLAPKWDFAGFTQGFKLSTKYSMIFEGKCIYCSGLPKWLKFRTDPYKIFS
jgi:hypothetical protein